ncbi:hypothetical protein, partial [Massilia sp.]|uniref:hypothetical protein n=1 Tax=Massilia sp. TaxID=1882437 RepID=UPI00289A349A
MAQGKNWFFSNFFVLHEVKHILSVRKSRRTAVFGAAGALQGREGLSFHGQVPLPALPRGPPWGDRIARTSRRAHKDTTITSDLPAPELPERPGRRRPERPAR